MDFQLINLRKLASVFLVKISSIECSTNAMAEFSEANCSLVSVLLRK